MKLDKKIKVSIACLSISLFTFLFAAVLTPSMASPSKSASLIDQDFEVALRKFIAKRFFHRINATPEQQEKLSKIFAETQDKTRETREKFRQGIIDLSSLMASEKASDDDIKAKMQEMATIREKLIDMRLDSLLQVRKELNSAQKQQIHSRVVDLISGGTFPRHI